MKIKRKQELLFTVIVLSMAASLGLFVYFHLSKFLIFVLLIGLGALAEILASLQEAREKKKIFAKREPLSVDEIYERYYANSGVSKNKFGERWSEIANTLLIPSEKLRPSDSFGKELGPYRVIDDNLDELEKIAAKHIKEMKIKVDLSTVKTLDDYIQLLCRE